MPRLALAITDFAPPPHGAAVSRLPALERLLARGTRRGSGADFRRFALAAAGIEAPARLPLAQVVAGRPGAFALATPVHLVAGLERVHLHPRGLPALAAGELAGIVASFNAQLGADGLALEVASPAFALLALPRPVDAHTHDPGPLAGREAGAWLPAGVDGGWLRRLMTETQMLLHEHPVNLARAARGELTANGLWLWGCGGEPLPAMPPVLPPLASGDAFLRALWRGQGARVAPPPADVCAVAGRDAAPAAIVTLELSDLHESPAEALALAEERWFGPLGRALGSGRLERLDLHLGAVTLSCSRRDWLRWWRRVRPWDEVLA